MRPVFIFGAEAGSRAFLSALLASHGACTETPPFTSSYLKAARGNLFGFVSQDAAFDNEAEFYLGHTGNASLAVPATVSRLVEAYASDHGQGDASLWIEHVAVRELPRLADTFPEARFLHLVCDGRTVAAARWQQPGEPRRPVRVARRWRESVLRGLEAEVTLGKRCLRLPYETLLHDLGCGLRIVGDFIGVSPEGFRIPPSVLHKDYALHLRRWRTQLTPDELWRFERVGGGVLSDLGYALEAYPSRSPQRPRGGRRGPPLVPRATLPVSQPPTRPAAHRPPDDR